MKTTKSITARGSFAGGQPVPLRGGSVGDDFDLQWMPPGAQDVVCFVNGEPRRLKFSVSARHAELFNGMLQELRRRASARLGDEPFFDFNHEDGAASGHPEEFYWAGDDPTSGGIRARGKWTGGGRTAVSGRDFTRFSPTWDFDGETEEPVGVSVNLGGLVNRAAFKKLAAVASDGQRETNTNTKQDEDISMDRTEFQQLLADGLKPFGERIGALEAKASDASKETATAQAGGIDEAKIVKLIQDGVKPLADRVAGFETAQANASTARAKEAVMAHVRRGAIAPEDSDTIGFWTEAMAKDAEKAQKQMARLPGKAFTRVTAAGGATSTATAGTEPEEQFIAKAKDFAKANNIQGGAAEVFTAYARTAEGKELYGQFRAKLVKR
jgi:hypothetical protein